MKEKELKEKNKGITLIALVVTIVVLLILAVISISILTGDNGIITKAKLSKEQTEIGKEKEYISLSFSAVKANKIARGDYSDITSEEMQEEMNKYTKEATVTGSKILNIKYTSGREYEVDGTGNIVAKGESYDGIYSEPGLEGKIAPENLFEYEIIDYGGEIGALNMANLPTKTARITRIKPEYCNTHEYKNEMGETFPDTNYEIIYNGEKISETLVIPYQVDGKFIAGGTIGEMYRITEVRLNEDYYTNLPNVETIIYPNTVTKVYGIDYEIDYYDSDGTFSRVSKDCNLKKIVFSNNLKEIPSYFCYGAKDLEYITIPSSVTKIGAFAFHNTEWLNNQSDGDIYINSVYYEYKGEMSQDTTISIKDGTVSISAYAFSGCSNLIDMIIPTSITDIGRGAFNYTAWIKKQPDGDVYINNIYYEYKGTMPNNTTITIKEGTKSITEYAFYRCKNLINITIPTSVTSIGRSAFSECSSLTSVTIPLGVLKIENHTFSSCNKLTNITIPDTVTNIGVSAFKRCTALTSITIPNSVTSICNSAFWNCSNLTSITIPKNVSNIGTSAFRGCGNLISIKVDENNKVYDSRNSCNAIINTNTNMLLLGGKNTIIPNTVTRIASYAFSECRDLTSITIPNNVTSIGNYAFYYCTGLTSITIPNSVKSIGNGAFSNCSSLTSITMSSSITSIGESVFFNTPWYNNLPDGNVYLGKVYYAYKGTMDDNTNIEIKEGTVSITSSAFSGCTGLTSITIPDSVTGIGDSAFYSCTSLTSITIPNSVTSIGNRAFYKCTKLTSITIPNSVTSIANFAFREWTSSQTINVPFKENELPSGWSSSWNSNCDATINYLQ